MLVRQRNTVVLLGLMLLLSVSCSSAPPVKEDNAIRLQVVRNTAISYGAKMGLVWRSTQINHALNIQHRVLDRVFDFRPLLLRQHLLSPVVVQSDGSININNPSVIRFADRTYQIVQAAKFVSTTPTWR